MKKYMTIILTGICFLLTACNEPPEKETPVPETTSAPVIQTDVEIPAPSETEAVTAPPAPSSPEAIQGIWKNDNSYRWFKSDGGYAEMNKLGMFPEEIGIEVSETSVTLNVSGEVLTLTQAGTHVFDTIDGLYNTAEQPYQVLIVGNIAYTYTDTGMTYSYNGETLQFSDVSVPCHISGDTMQYQDTVMTKTNELDDFLSATGGN